MQVGFGKCSSAFVAELYLKLLVISKMPCYPCSLVTKYLYASRVSHTMHIHFSSYKGLLEVVRSHCI